MFEINENVRRLDAAFKRRGFVRVKDHKWQGGWITVTYVAETNTFRCHFAHGKIEDLTFFDLLGNARDDSDVWEYVLLWADKYRGYDPSEDTKRMLRKRPRIQIMPHEQADPMERVSRKSCWSTLSVL